MKKRFLLGSLIGMLLLSTGCSSPKEKAQNWKLYTAITSNNLQGVREVLQSGETIPFLDLGYYELSTDPNGGTKKEGRALALAMEFSDDKVVSALIKAGAPVSNCSSKSQP